MLIDVYTIKHRATGRYARDGKGGHTDDVREATYESDAAGARRLLYTVTNPAGWTVVKLRYNAVDRVVVGEA